jgi:hypothetical protein
MRPNCVWAEILLKTLQLSSIQQSVHAKTYPLHASPTLSNAFKIHKWPHLAAQLSIALVSVIYLHFTYFNIVAVTRYHTAFAPAFGIYVN